MSRPSGSPDTVASAGGPAEASPQSWFLRKSMHVLAAEAEDGGLR